MYPVRQTTTSPKTKLFGILIVVKDMYSKSKEIPKSAKTSFVSGPCNAITAYFVWALVIEISDLFLLIKVL